jgi:hypothetical protein
VTGRESVFSNPLVIRTITERFVPVADDVSKLQSSDDDVGRFFRSVAVQGHMKGRSQPGNSHQGIYIFTSDGTELASGNPLQAEKTLAMIDRALARWSEIGDVPADAVRPDLGGKGTVTGYPEPGGAVLRMAARDLPRPNGLPEGLERYATQWNFDHVWLRPRDVAALVPEPLEVGAERLVPPELLSRIARFHLCDIVRGEPRVWGPDAVERFDLTTRVTAIEGGRAVLALRGSLVLRDHVAFRDAHKPLDWAFVNVLDAAVAGDAVWNIAERRFERFDLAVAGQREGAHRYNVRTADPGPAPIGFAFELAGDAPWERTPPHAMRTWTRPGERQTPVATVVTGEAYYGDT